MADEIVQFVNDYYNFLSTQILLNAEYEDEWAKIKSRSNSNVHLIHFDHLEIPPGFLPSSWFPTSSWQTPTQEPHEGFSMYDGNFIVGSDVTTFNSPGINNLKTFTGRSRIGIGPLTIPAPGQKTVIKQITGVPFDLVSIDMCPPDYNNLSLRFSAYDSGGVLVKQMDVISSADDPKRVLFTGFSRITEVRIEESDPGTKTVHPDKNPAEIFGVGIGMINIRYKM